MCTDVLVLHNVWVLLLQGGEFVEMRRKQTIAVQSVDNVVANRPGQTKAVKGGRAWNKKEKSKEMVWDGVFLMKDGKLRQHWKAHMQNCSARTQYEKK